jgi:hypothetical protein
MAYQVSIILSDALKAGKEKKDMAPQVQLPIPEIGAIAATRGMLGAGVALLLADKLPPDRKKKVGWTLFLIGALTTIPLVMDVAHKRIPSQKAEDQTAELID